MAEIEASLLAKIHEAGEIHERPVLVGFLRSRKKRIGTLIEAKDGQSLKELKREVKKKGGKKIKVYKEINTLYAEMPVDKVTDLASVSCAQKIYDAEGDIKPCLNESVPLVMGVEKWQLPYRVKHRKIEGRGIKVAVIDSGIDKKHPDFAWRIKRVKNFSGGRKYRGTEHGTHVAGIIAGSGKASGYRFTGVAPKVKLYIAKIFINSETPTTRETVIEATLWAVRKKVHIINMSFGDAQGCSDGTCPLCKIANHAVEKGISVIAAAGNVGPAAGTITCPGNAQDAITVGATTKTPPIIVTGFSSRGNWLSSEKPDLVAPGQCIISTQPGGQYATMTGTSMAAPHVTGLAALFYNATRYTKKPKSFSPDKIKHALKHKCIDLGEHPTAQGSGLVNFVNHLTAIQQHPKYRRRSDRPYFPKYEYSLEKALDELKRRHEHEEIWDELDNLSRIIKKTKDEEPFRKALRKHVKKNKTLKDYFELHSELFDKLPRYGKHYVNIPPEDNETPQQHPKYRRGRTDRPYFPKYEYSLEEALDELKRRQEHEEIWDELDNLSRIMKKTKDEKPFRKALKKHVKKNKTLKDYFELHSELFDKLPRYGKHYVNIPPEDNENPSLGTCPASTRIFCPHYDQNVCNQVYKNCLYNQSVNHQKVLINIKQNNALLSHKECLKK